MNTSPLPPPGELRGRLGREEFTRRLLSCLVLGRVERGWNVSRKPSMPGGSFLRDLHASAFGDDSTPEGTPGFVDEFELPARTEEQPSGRPDYGVVWSNRLFLVELKTERASHRPALIPYYLELAHHRHADKAVDLLYLTPTMSPVTTEAVREGQRFAHLTWAETAPLIQETWSRSDIPAEREMASYLVRLIDDIEGGRPLPPTERPPRTARP